MTIEIFDSLGVKLEIGDTVMLQERRNKNLVFYTKVDVINGQIFPLARICFDRMIRVNEIPSNCHHVAENKESGMPEFWVNHDVELIPIEKEILDTWRMQVCSFEHNLFFKVSK